MTMAKEYRFKNRSFQAQKSEILTIKNQSVSLLGRAIANKLNPPSRQDFVLQRLGRNLHLTVNVSWKSLP